jgi:phospholipid-binding lipoprotein MlaA
MRHLFTKSVKTFLVVGTSIILSACASNDQAQYSDVYDPFESYNRSVFAFNDALDDAVAKPVAKTYRAVLPEPARVGTQNVLRNLSTPVNAGNQLLQGDVGGMMTDIGRALINSTLGIAGLFDVAGKFGLEHELEDFGQTLAVWGVSEGPYVMIPLLGPSNLRDGTGRLVDAYADPLRHYWTNTEQEEWIYARMGVSVVSQRESLLDILDELEAGAIDYYAVMRSSYTQYRSGLVEDTAGNGSYLDIPDFDEE